MSMDRLITKILETGNPTVAGLDPKLSYVPGFIREESVKKYGKTDPPSTQRGNRHRSRGFTRGAEQFREGGDEK